MAGAAALACGQVALTAAHLGLGTTPCSAGRLAGSGSGEAAGGCGGSLSSVSVDSDAVAHAASAASAALRAPSVASTTCSPSSSAESSCSGSHGGDSGGDQCKDGSSSWVDGLPSAPMNQTPAPEAAASAMAGGGTPAPGADQAATGDDAPPSAAQPAEELSYADLTAQLADGLSPASSVVWGLQEEPFVPPIQPGAADVPEHEPEPAPQRIAEGAHHAAVPPLGRASSEAGSSSSDGGGASMVEQRRQIEQKLRDMGLGDALGGIHPGSDPVGEVHYPTSAVASMAIGLGHTHRPFARIPKL